MQIEQKPEEYPSLAPAITLCRAEHGGNVGAVCRAMESMGFSRLVLVDCPDYSIEAVKTFALKSFPVYLRAARHDSLETALSNFSYAAALTRRQGAKRRPLIPVQHWTRQRFGQIDGNCALVFGNEQTGLSDEELACCDENVHIPTAEGQPSLNLAQAVQLACWEYRRYMLEHDAKTVETQKSADAEPETANHAYILERTETYFDLLEPHSVFSKGNRAATGALLRSLLCRAACSPKEAARFFDFLENSAEQLVSNPEKQP